MNKIKSSETFVQAFTKKFGGSERFWIKIDENGQPFTGECCDMPNGLPLYDPYHDEEMARMFADGFDDYNYEYTYDSGLNPNVAKWVKSVGWEFQPYDSGRVDFYSE